MISSAGNANGSSMFSISIARSLWVTYPIVRPIHSILDFLPIRPMAAQRGSAGPMALLPQTHTARQLTH